MPRGVYVHTPESRVNQSKSMMGNLNGLGHIVSPETRAKMSVSQKGHPGHPQSIETRAKMSASRMGNTNSLGYRHTPEARMRIGAARIGQIATPETRAKISATHKGIFGSLNPCWKGGPVMATARHHAKRRLMGYVFLNKWFVGCDGHHVDNEQIIYMPKGLHQGKGLYHNHNTGQGMARMNAVAYNFLFKQEIANATRP